MAGDAPYFYAGGDIGTTKADGEPDRENGYGAFCLATRSTQPSRSKLSYRRLVDADGSIDGNNYSVKTDQASVSVLGSIAVADNVRLFTRVGVNHLSAKARGDISATESATRLLLGAGVSYSFQRHRVGPPGTAASGQGLAEPEPLKRLVPLLSNTAMATGSVISPRNFLVAMLIGVLPLLAASALGVWVLTAHHPVAWRHRCAGADGPVPAHLRLCLHRADSGTGRAGLLRAPAPAAALACAGHGSAGLPGRPRAAAVVRQPGAALLSASERL
ncbi:porin family protein [Massilia sp. H-1]|nr:porin family protein [Massilia sp. H-1]